MPKVEHLVYGDRKVFTVSAFNRGIGMHLGRLPAVGRGRGHRAAAERRVGERLPDAEGSEDRRDAQRHDRPSHLRRARARARRRGDRPRRGPRRDLRAEGGARSAGDDDRATRARRPSRARAAEAQARRRRALRIRPETTTPTRPPGGRDPDRSRRRRTRRSRRDDRRALPGDEGRRSRGARPGQGRRDAIVAALADLAGRPEVDVIVLARGGGSFEDSPSVQRRVGRPRRGRVARSDRLGGRARAGHAALRPRGRRASGDPHRGGSARGAARRRARARRSTRRGGGSGSRFAGRSSAAGDG